MWNEGLDHLTNAFSAVTKGEVELSHEIIRECNSVCHRLPILDNDNFKQDFYHVSMQ